MAISAYIGLVGLVGLRDYASSSEAEIVLFPTLPHWGHIEAIRSFPTSENESF